MANEQNLIPAKKGEIRNPKGRGKGVRGRATIVREWLMVEQKFKNPLTGQEEILSQADIMTLAVINKARKGDVIAFRELMDSGFGKVTNQSIPAGTRFKKGETIYLMLEG